MSRMLSRVGIGTYRMQAGSAKHEAALLEAVKSGVRVIDTSPNYSNGMAEKLVGKLFRDPKCPVSRDEVSIVSKFGFIQGEDLQQHSSKPWPNAVKYTDDAYHCLDPSFMESQLEGSLKRLETSYIDCYMVQNPEHFLMSKLTPTDSDASKISDAREELEQLLLNAFKALEEQVDAGRIGSYGLTSNSFVLPDSHPHAIPFKNLTSIANAASRAANLGAHSLSALQMPGNLLERTALASVEQGGNGAANWASQNGMDVLLNRPLSGFDNQGTWRLADAAYPESYTIRRDNLLELLSPTAPSAQDLANMTEEERKEVEDTMEACAWLRRLVTDLDAQIGEFSSVMHFQDDLVSTILPMLNNQMEEMDPDTAGMVYDFFMGYTDAVKAVTGFKVRAHLQRLREEELQSGSLYPVPELPVDMTLEQYAVNWLLKHESAPTVLVGLTDVKHVHSLASQIC